jgi:thiamine-phosphate diphosphorylase
VTDRAAARGSLAAAVEAAVRGGVDQVQLRERELEGAALLAHAREIAEAARAGARARAGGVRFLVNRRADVALAIAADGVHLGFDAMPPERARALLGPGAWIGISCHAPAEVTRAQGASYAQLAPIFAPLSKRASRPPLGPAALAAAASAGLPVLAQGGIEAGNAAAAIAAGAAGVAVTGAILLAADPEAAAAALRRALDSGAAAGPPMEGA